MKVAALNILLENYKDKSFIIEGFTAGFNIPFMGLESPLLSHNSSSALSNPSAVEQKLKLEINSNRIAGPFSSPPYKNFKSSPLAIKEKSVKGKFRLLHNLSHPHTLDSVNLNIPKTHTTVTYSSLRDAINMICSLQQPVYLAKADLADAFRLIPVSPSAYHLLGFKWNFNYYYDRNLPMGCAASCQIFERVSDALVWILNSQGVFNVIKVLDDFLFIANTQTLCDGYLRLFKEICLITGFPLAERKTVEPCRALTFLGFHLDTEKMIAQLPSDKQTRYKDEVHKYLLLKRLTLRELKSLLGKLQHATAAIRPGTAFLRRLYDLTCGLKNPNSQVSLSEGSLKDLNTWESFLKFNNGTALLSPPTNLLSTKLCLISDSSKYGFGGTFGTNWIQGVWPEHWKQFNIAFLEAYPILLLIDVFSNYLAHSRVLIRCDNMAVVEILNKMSSKDADIMCLIRHIALLTLMHDITLIAVHIPGKMNVLPDLLSRSQVTPTLLTHYGMSATRTAIPPKLQPMNFTFS